MANVQKQFEEFHDRVRWDFDMDETLRTKRDIILEKIANRLRSAGRPAFRRLLQGSYQMKTGVKPLRGESYDMDVGLRFDFIETEHAAGDVRRWVLDAIENHTDDVDDKPSCIRVAYAEGFHIDLVIYATWDDALGISQCRLAHRSRGWVATDPQKLLSHVSQATSRFAGSEGGTQIDQLRRIVRYFKRWDDVWMGDQDSGKLSGLAFTLLTIQALSGPRNTWDGKPDDLAALHAIAHVSATTDGRIVARKPTPEFEDMFGALDDQQMLALKGRFSALDAALAAAHSSTDPVEACKELANALGSDFPIPDPIDTGSATGKPAIVTSSSSA